MLTSIQQVNSEFFRLFHNLKIPVGNETKLINSRYARKSSKDYVEEQENQVYPCVAIQDYAPTLKDEWFVDMKYYLGDISDDKLTGYLFQRPVWMEFRYDVSVASKSYTEYLAMQDYFLQKYLSDVAMLFNRKLSGEDEVGDVIPYEIRSTDIPRTDGVYETNYEFTLSVWLYATEPKEVDLIQKVILSGHPIKLG